VFVVGGVLATKAEAADGTIQFTGAIVASPYETSHALVAMAQAARVRTAALGQLVFERQTIDRPSASVQVQAPQGQAPQISFVDSNARVSTLAIGETKAIGRDGGTLSMRPQAAGQSSLAMVIVSYD